LAFEAGTGVGIPVQFDVGDRQTRVGVGKTGGDRDHGLEEPHGIVPPRLVSSEERR
jgi:hypothetical protein